MEVIPQSNEIAELVERFTGQHQITTVQAARKFLSDASESRQRSQNLRNRLVVRRSCAVVTYQLARLWAVAVELQDRFHADPLVITATAGTAIGLILGVICILVFHATLAPTIIVSVGAPLALLVFTRSLSRKSPAEVKRIEERMHEVLRDVSSARQAASVAVMHARLAVEEARRIYAGVVKANQDPLVRLLNTNTGAMSGDDFEEYLADIFRYRGYQVERTGQTGDQGVDLIVSLGAGPRIAIQAKCYGGSVNNKAVQEVYTGMALYRCQGCVVVTSSQFTSGAREAATATGCLLIDGSQIGNLIRGRVVV
jgi:HJR/Mrr/RecB family endonuclease